MMPVLLFLLLHLLLCAAVFFGIAVGALQVRMELMPMVVFVPVWGVVCVLLIHFQLLLAGRRSSEIGVEKLRIQEEIYRSFLVPEQERAGAAPLEDVLLLDEAGTRRSQLMKLLNDDPSQYLELLQKARMNSDVEVVHYATTAMSELNKEYDLKLQRAEKRYSDAPDDPRRLEEYIAVLGDYLDKALAPERVQRIQRAQYAVLLQKQQKRAPTLENGAELVRVLLRLRELEEAEQALAALADRWPEQETVWLLRVECAARRQDGPRLRDILRQAEERQIYFTAQARKALAFWQQEERT